ncbi:MAG: CorA family divalent cation transporter [Candidatus Limimorpha sp.]
MEYSYHVFMFPFRWKINGLDETLFSEQIKLENISYAEYGYWERLSIPKSDKEKEGMYNEKNYFYSFVHNALYDDGTEKSFVRHFERKKLMSNAAKYRIDCRKGLFELDIKSIILDLYSTGVGVLQFHLKNTKYKDRDDIISINEFGRRIFPPFYYSKTDRGVIAKSIELVGVPSSACLREDFNGYTVEDSNKPAYFIVQLINEVVTNIAVEPVVDDRMFVITWYKNTEWVTDLCQPHNNAPEPWSDDGNWYRFIFIDSAASGEPSCQNAQMMKELLQQATYKRWQNWNSLYGLSRYSMVYLTTDDCKEFLTYNFETEYVRMAEHILVQRASVLRFSAEVSRISALTSGRGLSSKVDSLYKEYIRFVNQIHFREVSAQDQGIEMYDMMYKTMRIEHQVEKLDDEIEELYHYVSLLEDKKANQTMAWLTWAATIFVPVTVITAFFGMNNDYNGAAERSGFWNRFPVQIIVILISMVILIGVFKLYNSKIRRKK